jgi:hypothetical protein
VEKNELNPLALGYTFAIIGSLSYLIVRILMRQFGYGSWAIVFFKSLIFSKTPSDIWIIPEFIQMVIVGFISGYIIARLYNRLA